MAYDTLLDEIKKLPQEIYSDLAEYVEFLLFKFKEDPENFKNENDLAMERQRQFVAETAGKIDVDEQAIEELRAGSMI